MSKFVGEEGVRNYLRRRRTTETVVTPAADTAGALLGAVATCVLGQRQNTISPSNEAILGTPTILQHRYNIGVR